MAVGFKTKQIKEHTHPAPAGQNTHKTRRLHTLRRTPLSLNTVTVVVVVAYCCCSRSSSSSGSRSMLSRKSVEQATKGARLTLKTTSFLKLLFLLLHQSGPFVAYLIDAGLTSTYMLQYIVEVARAGRVEESWGVVYFGGRAGARLFAYYLIFTPTPPRTYY